MKVHITPRLIVHALQLSELVTTQRGILQRMHGAIRVAGRPKQKYSGKNASVGLSFEAI
jgi:hypothetical protein